MNKKPSKAMTDDEKADAKETYNSTLEKFHKKLDKPNKEEILDGTINLEITSDGIIFLVTSKLNNYTSKKVKIPKESAKALRSFLIEIYR